MINVWIVGQYVLMQSNSLHSKYLCLWIQKNKCHLGIKSSNLFPNSFIVSYLYPHNWHRKVEVEVHLDLLCDSILSASFSSGILVALPQKQLHKFAMIQPNLVSFLTLGGGSLSVFFLKKATLLASCLQKCWFVSCVPVKERYLSY